jgi:hypothetical protein
MVIILTMKVELSTRVKARSSWIHHTLSLSLSSVLQQTQKNTVENPCTNLPFQRRRLPASNPIFVEE